VNLFDEENFYRGGACCNSLGRVCVCCQAGSSSPSLTASPYHNSETPLSQHPELSPTYRNPEYETGISGASLISGGLKGDEIFICQRESQVALVGSFPTLVLVSTTSICLTPPSTVVL
jgi:hypothetical protein